MPSFVIVLAFTLMILSPCAVAFQASLPQELPKVKRNEFRQSLRARVVAMLNA